MYVEIPLVIKIMTLGELRAAILPEIGIIWAIHVTRLKHLALL